MPAAATLLVVGEKPGSEKLELAERRCGQVRRIDAAHFKFMLEQDLTVTPNEFAACFPHPDALPPRRPGLCAGG